MKSCDDFNFLQWGWAQKAKASLVFWVQSTQTQIPASHILWINLRWPHVMPPAALLFGSFHANFKNNNFNLHQHQLKVAQKYSHYCQRLCNNVCSPCASSRAASDDLNPVPFVHSIYLSLHFWSRFGDITDLLIDKSAIHLVWKSTRIKYLA